MTSTYIPTNVAQGFNQEVALNKNFADLKIALDQALTRQSTTSNALSADLDVATKKILNLPKPSDPLDVVRLTDVNSLAVTEVVSTITFATSLTIDISAITFALLTLTANSTVTFSGGATDGQVIMLRITQAGAGSSIITWANAAFSVDLPLPTLSTTVGLNDYYVFRFNAVSTKYDLLAINRGFSS